MTQAFLRAARRVGMLLGLGFAALAAVPAQAQDGNWDAVITAAKKEGKLLVYNGTNFPIVKRIADKFTAEFGIQTEVLSARTTEIRERMRVEQATGRTVASVAYNGFTTLFVQMEEGVFQPHGTLPNGKSVAEPLKLNGTMLPIVIGNFVLMYNTNLVKGDDVPKSWQDITHPKWQGKILADDFRAAGAGNVWFEATLNAFGKEFHEKVAAQKPVFSRNFPDSERRVARGEYPLYMPFNVSEYPTLQGLPVKAIVPAEGAAYVAFGAGLLRDAPQPNAGKLFMNYMLSQDAQIMQASEGYRPAAAGLEGKYPDEVKPLLMGKLLGTTTPGRLTETTKLAEGI
jgi:iron(III) transport system substrate-binding protein